MTLTKPLLIFVLCAVSIVIARDRRHVGTFELGRHPIVTSIDSLNALTRRLSNRELKNTVKIMATIKNPDQLQRLLKPYHWEILSNQSSIATLRGPAQTAPYLKAFDDIITINNRLPFDFPSTTMDSARLKTTIDHVQGTRSTDPPLPQILSGKGVLLGIIDNQFDTHHAAFLDSTGQTRFIAVWDQGDTTSGQPNRCGYGVIKNKAQFEADSNFAMGTGFHGTLITSYAAGGDTTLPYYGVAKKSPIIAIRYTKDIETDVVNGLRWICSVADSLNMPCVINLSIGISYGPHDGTSLVDRTIDSLSGAGRIIVGAVGNDRQKKSHISFTLARNEVRGTWCTALNQVVSTSPPDTLATAAIDIWGEPNKTISAGFDILDITTKNYKNSGFSLTSLFNRSFAPDTVFWTDSQSGKKDTVVFYLSAEQANPRNNKGHIQAAMTTTNPSLTMGVRISLPNTSGTIHAWNMEKKWFEGHGIAGYYAGDSNYTVNEIGGTAHRIITVGGYVTRTRYYTWDNVPHDEFDSSTLGMLSHFSSFGPTVDGRVKPDITAPGNVVIGAMSRGAPDAGKTIVWPDITTTNNRYCVGIGSSVSSPIVAGIVALMLEARPTLTPDSVKYYLRQSAIQDAFTGPIAVANNQWGMGKVDALGAVCKVLGILLPTGVNAAGRITLNLKQLTVHRLNNRTIMITCGNPNNTYKLSVYDLAGRIRYLADGRSDQKITLPLSLPAGIYLTSIGSSTTMEMFSLALW